MAETPCTQLSGLLACGRGFRVEGPLYSMISLLPLLVGVGIHVDRSSMLKSHIQVILLNNI